jgi:secretory phospholipase A2
LVRLIVINRLTFTFSNDDEGRVLLRKLSRINRPLRIDFGDMLKLMKQCDQVDRNHDTTRRKAHGFAALYDRNSDLRQEEGLQADEPAPPADEDENNRGLLSGNPFSLFSGVFPGTKWCGTGDIAKNFHDLGTVSGRGS